MEDTAALAHHAYLCKAGVDVAPEFNKFILHVACYKIREAVKEVIKSGNTWLTGET